MRICVCDRSRGHHDTCEFELDQFAMGIFVMGESDVTEYVIIDDHQSVPACVNGLVDSGNIGPGGVVVRDLKLAALDVRRGNCPTGRREVSDSS